MRCILCIYDTIGRYDAPTLLGCYSDHFIHMWVWYCAGTAGLKADEMAVYLLGVMVFGALIQNGLAIMCYECNSATNSLCNQGVLPESLKRNCSDHDRGVTHTMCRKIIQHVDYGVNGKLPESRVIRACGWDETKFKGMCYHRSGFGGHQEVCSCTTDYCNSSHQSTATLAVLSATVLTAFVNTISN